MLNRSALIIRSKQAFVDWLNSVDPYGKTISLEQVNDDNTVYLIEVEDSEELAKWLKKNLEAVFVEELSGWYNDENLWPKKLDMATFKKWFDLDWHSVVMDKGSTHIVDDEEMETDDEEFEIDDDADEDLADPGAGRR